MGSPLGPTLANPFLCFYEKKKKKIEQLPVEFKPVYYRRYVGDIFVLFLYFCIIFDIVVLFLYQVT